MACGQLRQAWCQFSIVEKDIESVISAKLHPSFTLEYHRWHSQLFVCVIITWGNVKSYHRRHWLLIKVDAYAVWCKTDTYLAHLDEVLAGCAFILTHTKLFCVWVTKDLLMQIIRAWKGEPKLRRKRCRQYTTMEREWMACFFCECSYSYMYICSILVCTMYVYVCVSQRVL